MHLYHFRLPIKARLTLTDENRSFKTEWKVDNFMIETPDQGMICLICKQALKLVKSDNAKQHFFDIGVTVSLNWTGSQEKMY